MRSLTRMPQRQARGRVGQAAVMRSVLEHCNPTQTRLDLTGRVGFRIVRFGSGRVKIIYCLVRSGRVEFSTQLQPSNRYGVRFAYS